MGAEPVIAVTGLAVRYGEATAVHDLDLEVRAGAVVGLIGPDGAGKSSTLRVIGGLQRATAGRVDVLGRDAWRHRRALHHSLGYLAQRFALYGDLTVDENVQFFAQLYGVPGWRERRTRLLELVGLERFRDRLADRLSGGMRQKLALACALMHGPRLLLLDEPTTGVDPVTRREFWRLLAELVADGLTLLVATPYLDEAERCSRVVLMLGGRVLADDTPAALRAALPGRVFELDAAPRGAVAAALATVPGVLDVQSFAARFHVRCAAGVDAAHLRSVLAAAGVTVAELRPTAAGIEDAFLHLIRSSEAA
jgi:ABC-2 type transport system ATP-binding protein